MFQEFHQHHSLFPIQKCRTDDFGLPINQIDLLTLSWALHRLSGISSPANAAYSLEELVHQLKSSGSKALFTCAPLLPTAVAAAAKSGIPKNRIYLLDLPQAMLGGKAIPKEFKTIDDLIAEGSKLPTLAPLKWEKGQGARQTAFLCYSSGTSGLPVRDRLPYLRNTQAANVKTTERRHDVPP